MPGNVSNNQAATGQSGVGNGSPNPLPQQAPGDKGQRRLGKRVLLVDDQQAVRGAIHLLLNLDGHAVTEAEDGVQALELFEQQEFDLVITDQEMPRMKGNQLTLKIKEAVPRQPVLMISAYEEHVGQPGNPADAILLKPFRLEDLRKAVARVLSSDVLGGGQKK
jgi:CheY-like chemotaxis protein